MRRALARADVPFLCGFPDNPAAAPLAAGVFGNGRGVVRWRPALPS
jgi:hypothetical protein